MGARILAKRGRKPSTLDITPEYEKFAEPTVRDLHKCLADALREAHCPEPESTAYQLLLNASPGRSPSTTEALGNKHGYGVDDSTLGKRLKKMMRSHYANTLNKRLRAMAWKKVQRFPASDGQYDGVGDGHEKPYKEQNLRRFQIGCRGSKARLKHEEGKIRAHTPDKRSYWSHDSHASNKKTSRCTKYFLFIITWLHNGQRLFAPIHFSLLGCREDTWQHHANLMVQTFRDLDIPIRCVLLDRWYDAADLRRFFRRNRIGCVVRLRYPASPEFDRKFDDLDQAKETTLMTEMAALANTIAVPIMDDWLQEGAQRTSVPSRTVVKNVIFDDDSGPVKLILKAILVRNLNGAGWVIDTSRSVAVIADCTADAWEYADLYLVRWTVETTLLSFSLMKGAPRPSLINVEYAEYTAVMAMLAVASTTKAVLAAMGGRLYDVPVRRYSNRLLGWFLIDDLILKVARELG